MKKQQDEPEQSSKKEHELPQLPQLSGSCVVSVQYPLQHVNPWQLRPQPPQLLGSLVVSTQLPEQFVSPPLQVWLALHVELAQVAAPPPDGGEHAKPQEPQFSGSVVRLVQAVLPGHCVSPCAAHDSPHVPPLQVSTAVHVLPQDPQLAGSELMFAQNVVQLDQLESWQVQLPPTHCCVVALHAVPQAPQLVRLVEVSTQPVEQSVSVPGQPHVPPEQVDVPGQACPQLPQFVALVSSSTQALPQTLSPAGHWQWPATQAAPVAQAVPHAPQFCALVMTFTQTPPQTMPPLGHSHTPPAQMSPGPQACPHVPQFAGSVVVSTQLPAEQA